jgi:16S rRNA (guanine966-N2)-methyltransferase
MRIIGGSMRGRNFESVPGHRTHPMSEKIRGAIFNALGDIEGLRVLDAYSGTGALSFEALSRGAESATALDSSLEAVRTIKENAEKLGVAEQLTASRIFVKAWTRRNTASMFDIAFVDPPYNAVEPKDLLALSRHVKQGGLIILSLPPNEGFRYAQSRQELLSHKNYGDASLYFYRQL